MVYGVDVPSARWKSENTVILNEPFSVNCNVGLSVWDPSWLLDGTRRVCVSIVIDGPT